MKHLHIMCQEPELTLNLSFKSPFAFFFCFSYSMCVKDTFTKPSRNVKSLKNRTRTLTLLSVCPFKTLNMELMSVLEIWYKYK